MLLGEVYVGGGNLVGTERTVVVYEVGYADAEEGGVEAGVETSDSLPLNNTADRIERRGLSALRLDLSPSGQGDEGVAIRDAMSAFFRI